MVENISLREDEEVIDKTEQGPRWKGAADKSARMGGAIPILRFYKTYLATCWGNS